MRTEPLSGLLRGQVEVDETYVGGKPRRYNNEASPRGRGTKKAAVMVLVERDGSAIATPIKRVDAETLKGAIRQHVDCNAMILTDEWAAYQGLGREFKGGHFSVNHAQGEYYRGGAGVNTAESFFALFKRGVVGSFHHVSKRHLARYVDEFSWRWNHRKLFDAERTIAALMSVEGKRLMYKEPITH
jgi:transposase-like protein